MISHNYLNYDDLINETNENLERNILQEIFNITNDILYNERQCKKIMNKHSSIVPPPQQSNEDNSADLNNTENKNNINDTNNVNNNDNKKSNNDEQTNNDNDDVNINTDNNANETQNNYNNSDNLDNDITYNNKNENANENTNTKNIDKLIRKLYKNISLHLHPDKGNKSNHFAVAVVAKQKKDISKLIYIYMLNKLDTLTLNLTDRDIYILNVEKDKLMANLSNIKKIANYLVKNS